MAQNGANMAQFDFCEGDQIEWTPCANELPFSEDWKGLNEYNQQNAWKMDQRFQTAEELGIFFGFPCSIGRILTTRRRNFLIGAGTEIPITIKTAVRRKTYPNFLKSQPAKKYVRYYLKYVAARWGYSPNLMTYELWNEIDAPEVMWRAGEGYDQEPPRSSAGTAKWAAT